MSTPEERTHWRRHATRLTQLGLGPHDPTPVDAVEEAANAVLALLDEVASLEDDRTRRAGSALGCTPTPPGSRLYLGDTSEWP